MRRSLGDGFELDDDRERVDMDAVHRFLARESYWAPGRSLEEVSRLIDEAQRVVGLYHDDAQIGFSRTVTDDASIAYLADVYVLPEFRGRGLGLELLTETVDRGPYAGRRWILHTADAKGLYARVGFGPPSERVMERPNLGIVAATDGEMSIVRRLFIEYGESLGFESCFEDFDKELDELPGTYEAPLGRILIARRGDEVLGCVGLRPAGKRGVCEMKRLYVRPAHRSGGVGRALTVKAIAVARALDYERVVLATLASMKEADGLYRSLGFSAVEPYSEQVPGSTCLGLELG